MRLLCLSKLNIVEIIAYYCKNSSLKDGLSRTQTCINYLKQQISQKSILLVQYIAKISLCYECEVISSFVIFAVLDLRVGRCRL